MSATLKKGLNRGPWNIDEVLEKRSILSPQESPPTVKALSLLCVHFSSTWLIRTSDIHDLRGTANLG